MELKNVHTRFRAYQMTVKGSSFSYWDNSTGKFVLGEARYNDENKASILHELAQCGKASIDHLYISSWDQDHCTSSELQTILNDLKPSQILYPGYQPNVEKINQVDSMKLIDDYIGPPKPSKYNGKYTGNQAQAWEYSNFTQKNGINTSNPNDNSVIHMWRVGNFSVLSLGDLESSELSKYIGNSNLMKEVDVLILPHHGSSKEFTTKELLDSLDPKLCLALVDRMNQYGHPDSTVENRARDHSRYISTKDGDIIIETCGNNNTNFQVYNYIASGDKLESIEEFEGKKVVEYKQKVLK